MSSSRTTITTTTTTVTVSAPPQPSGHRCANFDFCGNYIGYGERRNICYECNCD